MAAASVISPIPALNSGPPPVEQAAEQTVMSGPMVWHGSQFADETTFVFHLTKNEIAEVDAAAAAFEASGLNLGHLCPEKFPLPTLGPRLRLLSKRVHDGVGFFVLRGLEPWRYRRVENTIVFAGIASYIGNSRGVQCPNGPVMTHIFDYSKEVEEKEKVNDGYLGHANRASSLPFHSDDGHVITLYCLKGADIGGRTMLASSWAIYNRLMATRPDIIETLKEDWLWDSFSPANPSFKRALLLEEQGKLICNYRIRPFLGTPGYPRNAALGPLPAHHAEALEVVGQLAEEMCLRFQFQTGDLQFLNNLSILHAREEFQPSEGGEHRRHLLRLVLRDDELGWTLPKEIRAIVDKMFDHEPDEEEFIWSPEPLPYVIGQ